jgi:hypothetical protein
MSSQRIFMLFWSLFFNTKLLKNLSFGANVLHLCIN